MRLSEVRREVIVFRGQETVQHKFDAQHIHVCPAGANKEVLRRVQQISVIREDACAIPNVLKYVQGRFLDRKKCCNCDSNSGMQMAFIGV